MLGSGLHSPNGMHRASADDVQRLCSVESDDRDEALLSIEADERFVPI